MSLLHSVRNKPPMFTQNTNYSSWRTDFEAYISSNDPDMWIPLLERYERPVVEGTKREKSYKSMTSEERKALNDEKKTLAAIQMSLPMEILKQYKHLNNVYDLWLAFEKRCGGWRKEEEPQNSAFVAQIQEVDYDAFECLSCIKLAGSNNRYRDIIEEMQSNLQNLTEANRVLKENEFAYEKKFKAYQNESKEFKAKIYSQQDEIDSYLKMISLLKKELAEYKSEVDDHYRQMSNFATSNMIFDHILDKQRTNTKSKAGIGYHSVPPPADHSPLPNQDEIKNFVPFTRSKEDTKSVAKLVKESVCTSPVSAKEVVEVEDLSEESTIKVEKINVKPENFIITTENDERFK